MLLALVETAVGSDVFQRAGEGILSRPLGTSTGFTHAASGVYPRMVESTHFPTHIYGSKDASELHCASCLPPCLLKSAGPRAVGGSARVLIGCEVSRKPTRDAFEAQIAVFVRLDDEPLMRTRKWPRSRPRLLYPGLNWCSDETSMLEQGHIPSRYELLCR